MTSGTELMHAHAKMGRRWAVSGGVSGVLLLIMTGIVAAHGETWHAALAGIAGGATTMGALLTYVNARRWDRAAYRREAATTKGGK